MGLTYEWKLTGLKKQDTADINDLVVGTQWKLIGTNENGIDGTFSGATPLDIPDAGQDGYIPYAELTEEGILGWIKNLVSGSNASTNYMSHIDEQILKQIKSKEYVVKEVSEGDMPWSETSGSSEPNMGEPAEPAAV
tara:strand:- start:37 stop:447 length:411 start_codon:yes stop_codon:yes gene_type:complete